MASRPELLKGAAWADEAFAKRVLPRREVGAHKWGVGGVMVIAGSPSYIGAAYLTCRTAGRSGAGVVHLAASRGVIAMLAGAMPEVAHIPLPETDMPGAARLAVERIGTRLEKDRAVVIGPGLGEDELAHHLLSTLFGFGGKGGAGGASIGFGSPQSPHDSSGGVSPLFAHEHLRVVIDADALKWLADQDEWWKHMPGERMLLTPHIGEMERLTGLASKAILADPQKVAADHAKKWGAAVLLKGGHSVASDGSTTFVAETAPVSLATAGSGDVLAGMAGAFLAQGLSPLDAAALSLYVGTGASLAAEERFGELGVIATDLPDAIAGQLKGLA